MRRIKPEFIFDIWLKALSPSEKLLADYQNDKVNWEIFSNKFSNQVLNKQDLYLNLILEISKKNKVTLLCWEKKNENCHRFLIAEKLEKMQPGLKIKNL